MANLWPPLSVIESDLAEAVAETSSPPACKETIDEVGAKTHTTAIMPDFMQAMVARKVAAQSAEFAETPTAGQVRATSQIIDAEGKPGKRLNKPYAILLDQNESGDVWRGWMVASETDYASYWDMLLDDRDLPFDPLAGMVQIWNPVRCRLPADSRPIAQLSAERLEAVRDLARDFGTPQSIDDTPRPGFVAPRHASSGAVVLAGTLLGDAHDLRRAYQTLYLELAQEISRAVQPSNVSVLKPKKPLLWMKPALAIAATVLLVQGIVIQQLLGPHAPGLPSEDLTRGLVVPQDKLLINVYFKPTAQEMQIRKLLNDVKGRIVSGPGEHGEYQILIAKEQSEQTIDTMSHSEIVDSVTRREGSK